MAPIPWLNHSTDFPHPNSAMDEPDGLLALGGDLAPARIKAAYQQGIYPFYEEDSPKSPILWWSPSRRAVLFTDRLHISRSLRRQLNKRQFKLSWNQAFANIIRACADRPSTWITPKMQAAYIELHHQKAAHSVEVWEKDVLVGGLYGIGVGQMFFAESMFSKQTNASKVAMVYLSRRLQGYGYPMVDCQLQNSHLQRMGVVEIPRTDFLAYLDRYINQPEPPELCSPTQPDFI